MNKLVRILILIARFLLPALTVVVLTLLVLRGAVAGWPDVWTALAALWQGAFGTPYDIGNTLNKTTPLILTGLGVAVAFRARMWNIGGEGQFLLGAVAASAVGAYRLQHTAPIVLIPLMLVAGLLAGAGWGALAGIMRIKRNVPEVISTIMLNFVAFELLSYLLHGPMQESTHAQPASDALPDQAMLPVIVPHTTLHAGLWIALIASVVVFAFLFYTRAGFALRVAGANPDAARAAGIDVPRTLLIAMLWSGALCGLGGSVELSGVLGTLYESYAPGYGFTAIAVALLGRLNPLGIVGAALFFGALTSGCGSMERVAGVSFALSYVIQAVTLLVLLAYQRVKWSAE
jgi:ABC-type uncharacterized transport system permease subunit